VGTRGFINRPLDKLTDPTHYHGTTMAHG
jgi:hypothetical protein